MEVGRYRRLLGRATVTAASPTASKMEKSFEEHRSREKGDFHPLGLSWALGMAETKFGHECKGDCEMSTIGKWMDA